RLEATVYRPEFEGKLPLVIINHGSTSGGAVPNAQTNTYEPQARFFLDRGFAVIAPMRKGRGKSEGSYCESEAQGCDFDAWSLGLASALEDLEGVIEYACTLPYVDPVRIVLVGMSRGGFLSVAYSGRGQARQRVLGVINFVGGWVCDWWCPDDFNRVSFSTFGKQAQHRMLWLYADNDATYGESSVRSYAKAFIDAGGQADFKLYSGVPGDGHYLQNHLGVWEADANRFLESLGFAKLGAPGREPPYSM
ncbi:MAG: alpha/beta hydrolase family protein, partial [Tepidisphaeraceae bacterium]